MHMCSWPQVRWEEWFILEQFANTYMMSGTSGAGTVYRSRAPEFIPGL
jgi:hypothetical protein